jgi:hypothetical protein
METLEKKVQTIQFRTMPEKEIATFEKMPMRFPFKLTPHLDAIRDEVLNSVLVTFRTLDVKDKKIKAGEKFTLRVGLLIRDPKVELKDVWVRLIANLKYVHLDPKEYPGMTNEVRAHFEAFSYEDRWIFTDLKLIANQDLPKDARYDIADIMVDADIDFKKLFHIEKQIKDVLVYMQA